MRARRGFSLLEVAAAAALFGLISLGISLAVGTALANRATAAIRHQLSGEMDLALNEVAYKPFDELLENTFTPPTPCLGDAFLGTDGTTCIDVANRRFEIEWAVSFGTDAVELSTEAVSSATVVGTTTLPDGSTLTRTRRISAPTPGFNGAALLRVQALGEFALVEGPLYLINASNPTEVIATADMRSYGTALFRVAAGSCSDASPCRLALAPSNSWTTDGVVALAPASSIGTQALITLTSGVVQQVGVEIFLPATIDIDLWAESDLGARAPADVENSICLWASFNDGAADRLVPSCNDTAAAVSFATYAFDPDNLAYRAPFPSGIDLTLSVDHPNGSCPDLGQRGARAGVFEAAAVCTSWTWGVPATLTIDDTATAFTAPVRLDSGVNEFTATWSGDLARPATGYGPRPMWKNPRSIGACAATETCTSIIATAPEADVCPGELCLSARVPYMEAPSTGIVNALEISASSTLFDLEVNDPYGDPVQVQVIDLPQSGTLYYGGVPIGPGEVLGTTAGGGTGSFEIEFVEDTTIELVWFTVRLSNTVPDGVLDVEVALYRDPLVWSFSTTSVEVGQSESATISLSAIGVDSGLPAGEILTLSADAGLTVPSTKTVSASGIATFSVSAGAITPGAYEIQVAAPGGRSTTIPVTVLQRAASAVLTAADVAQGAQGTATITVRDAEGELMPAANVSFATGAGARFVTGVRPVPAGCITGLLGTCTVQVVADSSAPAGSYTLTATVGSAIASDGFTVTSVPAALAADRLSIRQGTSAEWTLILQDGAGTALTGRTVALGTLPAGVSVTPASRTSSATGEVTFTVAVSGAASVGAATLPFTASSTTISTQIDITATPATLSVPTSFTVLRESSVSKEITILDGAGDPVAGAALIADVPSGFSVDLVPSDEDGVVPISITALATAPKGTASIGLTAADEPGVTATLALNVVAPPATTTFSGQAVIAGQSELSVSVIDIDGDPVADAIVEISGLPSSLRVSPRAITDASGIAEVLVTDTGLTPEGAYRARATVTFLDAPRFWMFLLPVVNGATGWYPPAATSAPTLTVASSSTIEVSWAAPGDDGGAPVDSYNVYVNGALHTTSASTSTTLSALTSGTAYSVQVAACNLYGCAPVSAASAATTYPAVVSLLAAAATGERGTLAVSWTLPSDTLTGLTLRTRPTSGGSWTSRTLTISATSYTLRSLTDGTSYDVQVGTSNAAGTTWSATVAATPIRRPSAPTSLSITTLASTASLTWSAPTSTGGAAISSYLVFRDDALIATVAGTSYDDTSISGSHTWRVQACNTAGCSASSSAVSATL